MPARGVHMGQFSRHDLINTKIRKVRELLDSPERAEVSTGVCPVERNTFSSRIPARP
jgi:hypothetical protein